MLDEEHPVAVCEDAQLSAAAIVVESVVGEMSPVPASEASHS
jgi:hypothetical protein